jgi:hypothetical protein
VVLLLAVVAAGGIAAALVFATRRSNSVDFRRVAASA